VQEDERAEAGGERDEDGGEDDVAAEQPAERAGQVGIEREERR
jgi:hypothetical protein